MHFRYLPDEVVVVILRSLDARSIASAARTCRAFWCVRLDVVLAAVRRFPFADRCRVLRVDDVDDRAAAFSYPDPKSGDDVRHVVEKKATRPKLRLNARTATEWMHHIERLYDWVNRLSDIFNTGCVLTTVDLAELASLSVPPWASPQHPSVDRRVLVLRALEALSDAPSPLIRLFCVPSVLSILQCRSYDVSVRAGAVRVLGRLEPHVLNTHREALRARVEDVREDRDVRLVALYVMGKCDSEWIINCRVILFDLMNHNPELRHAALCLFLKVQSDVYVPPDIVENVWKHTNDPQQVVRDTAKHVLRGLSCSGSLCVRRWSSWHEASEWSTPIATAIDSDPNHFVHFAATKRTCAVFWRFAA